MERAHVNSRTLKSVGYDPATKTLEVEFHDGDVYRYFSVPPVVHRDLIHAASIGRYFAHFIKTTFRCRKVGG